MAKGAVCYDDYWKHVIPISEEMLAKLGWKLATELTIEQPNDQSDYLIIHKVDRKSEF